MNGRPALLLACTLFVQVTGLAQVPFDTSPTWVSTAGSNYSTGVAWADINNDGWLDLVVANGNDMARQHVVVYYNAGGTLPFVPDWQSVDIDYHGHVAVGDINNDGWVDVAVSVYIGPAGFSQKGRVKLYLNNGGVLSSLPAWTSSDQFYSFSCAFGDADGNGRLDLAVACGEAYYSRPEQNRIYYNRGGMLDTLPGWKSSQAGYSYDVGWGDIDDDGDLDLVFANERGPNTMFRNYGDSAGTVPTWVSTDPSQQANSLFIKDVNNDGFLDLAVSDNNQLGGSGKFKMYLNDAGTLETIPFWSSAWGGYGSGITLVDLNNNEWPDLITGGWWQPCRIYMNDNGNFPANPQWTSSTSSVVEAIVVADYDHDGLDTLSLAIPTGGERRLFYVSGAPFHRLQRLAVGTDTVALADYCYDLENGWFSLATAPPNGEVLNIVLVTSRDRDFAVSNWDPTIGNYIFRNTTPPVSVNEGTSSVHTVALYQNCPNPFNPSTTIRFQLTAQSFVKLTIHDLLGREVGRLVNDVREPGLHVVRFDGGGLSSGVYFYRLTVDGGNLTRRLTILK